MENKYSYDDDAARNGVRGYFCSFHFGGAAGRCRMMNFPMTQGTNILVHNHLQSWFTIIYKVILRRLILSITLLFSDTNSRSFLLIQRNLFAFSNEVKFIEIDLIILEKFRIEISSGFLHRIRLYFTISSLFPHTAIDCGELGFPFDQPKISLRSAN